MRQLLLPTLALALCSCGQQQPAPESRPTSAPSPLPSPPVSTPSAAAVDLAPFVGTYPFDKRDGVTFLGHPAVRAAVEQVVTDADVRAWVLDADVTASPIARQQDRIVAWACEPHNCGPHNWAITIRPDGTEPAVCYYEQERRLTRWYPPEAGRGADAGPGEGCPSPE